MRSALLLQVASAIVVFSFAVASHAQSQPAASPAETPPAAAPPPTTLLGDALPLPPPPPATNGSAGSVWGTPPPLSAGERYVQPTYVPSVPVMQASQLERVAPRVCTDDQRAGRIAASVLASTATVTGSIAMIMFASRSENASAAVFGLVGAISYITLPPLAVSGVSHNFGGNGKYWASLLGGLLIPVLGHVGGYELSHDTICPGDEVSVHGRRAPLALREDPSGHRWAPLVAPNGLGGGTLGITVSF